MYGRRETKREHGQIMILFALSLVVILGFAAIVIDLGMLRNNRQTLVNAFDSAALAGGTYANITQLDQPAAAPPTSGYQTASTVINQTIAADYPGLPVSGTAIGNRCVFGVDPNIANCAYVIKFKCLIGVDPATGLPFISRDITAVCDPHNALGHVPTAGTAAADFPGAGPTRSSNCRPDLGDSCNTVTVVGSSKTQFGFGPAVGVNSGSSGTVTSASCKGPCGASPIVPVDLVMILDRTGSMADTNPNNNAGPKIQALQGAAYAVLQVYDPAKQRVALGLTGPSKVNALGGHQLANCQYPSLAGVTAATQVYGVGDDTNLGKPAFEVVNQTNVGAWIPVGLSGTDTDTPLPAPRGVAGTYSSGGVKLATSDIVKAISCIGAYTQGTNLATPIEMAQWYLDNFGRPGVTQGIILETDGQPETHGTDINFTCGEAIAAASAAKADKTNSKDGIQIFTVGYGVGANCPTIGQNSFETATWAGQPAAKFLQAVSTNTGPADNSHFFNNPPASQLAKVFTQAATTLAKNPAQLIQIYPQPIVTGIAPSTGTHLGGTSVTITGNYFTGATAVTFGGTPAASFTVNNDTTITAVAPAGTIGTSPNIVVTTGGGSSVPVPADVFTYN